MEIDPKLLVIKPVNELESVTGLQAGELLFYDGSDNLKKIDIATFNNLSKTAKPLKPTDPTPTAEGLYKPTISGTYTNAGGLISQVGYDTLFFFNGTTWTKSEFAYPQATQSIVPFSTSTFPLVAPMPPNPPIQRTYDNFIWELQQGQTASITDVPGESNKWVSIGGEKVLETYIGVNKFDKSKVINGYYLDTALGEVLANANSSVSDWIYIDKDRYYLSGRYVGTGAYTAIRFKDNNGNILKPVDANGVDRANYTMVTANGILYKPTNAVAVQFAIKFANNGNPDTIQLEEGVSFTGYQPYNEGKLVKSEYLPKQKLNFLLEVSKNINGCSVRIPMDEEDIVVTLNNSLYANNILNFMNAKTIQKNEETSANGLQLHGAGVDDAAPPVLNSMYIGGNHGNTGNKTITANGHGKTVADVGSIWQDGDGTKWFLIKFHTSNQLWIISENLDTSGHNWSFKASPTGVLTHVSGAQNTANITPTVTSTTQLYPAVKNLTQKYFLNDKEISENDLLTGDRFTVIESYEIIDTVDMVNKLVANKPPSGYTTQPLFTNGDAIAKVTNTYRFAYNSNVLIDYSLTALKSITFGYFGGQQSEYVQPSWVTSYERYIPNSLPISSYDFRTPVSIISGNLTTNLNFTSTYWEDNAKPINRVVDIAGSNTKKYNFNLGFLPKGSRDVDVNIAWFIRNSRKSYPYAFDGKVSTVLSRGESRQGTMFRGWSKKTTERTNSIVIEDNNTCYVIVDYHEIKFDSINIPAKYQGGSISVVESKNVELKSQIVSSSVDLISNSTYGYITLKISI